MAALGSPSTSLAASERFSWVLPSTVSRRWLLFRAWVKAGLGWRQDVVYVRLVLVLINTTDSLIYYININEYSF